MGNALEDKTAVVTGAGRGIGRAVALLLAEHGTRVVVNDPSDTSEKVQRMMRGEGIPREVKQVLLHRTPTGPVTVTADDIARLESRGLEVVQKPMLSVETVSIRGIESEAISYEKQKLLEAIV